MENSLARRVLTAAEHRQLSQHRYLVGSPVSGHKRALLGVLRQKPRSPQTLEIHRVDQDQSGEGAAEKIWGQQIVDHTCAGREQTRGTLGTGHPSVQKAAEGSGGMKKI